MSVNMLLGALTNVKRTGRNKWTACCPCHDSKGRASLAIRELDDGKVLMWDFGGCHIEQVLGAIGMTTSDLSPPRPTRPGAGTAPERRPLLPSDVFEIARHELGIVVVVAAGMLRCGEVSQRDLARLITAHGRLERIAEVAYGR